MFFSREGFYQTGQPTSSTASFQPKQRPSQAISLGGKRDLRNIQSPRSLTTKQSAFQIFWHFWSRAAGAILAILIADTANIPAPRACDAGCDQERRSQSPGQSCHA